MRSGLWITKPGSVIHKVVCRSPVIHKPPCPAKRPAPVIELGLSVVRDTLANNYIRPDEATKAQSKVKQKGRHTFIDKVNVRLVRQRSPQRW